MDFSSQENLLDAADPDPQGNDGSKVEGHRNARNINGDNESAEKTRDDGPTTCLGRLRNIVTVEPVLFLYFLAFIPTYPLTQEYIRQFFSLKYNLTEGSTHAVCLPNSTNSSHRHGIEAEVQAATSQFMVFLNLANLIPACLAVLFLGAYTDEAGRKGVLLIPMVTGVFKGLLYICVIQLQLDIKYLLIGNIIDGLSGGATTVITSCFAYIADITSEKHRSFRIYALELGIGLGIAVSQIYTGYMIETLGFVYPFLLTELLYAINLVFVIIYVKDSLKPKKNVKLIDIHHLKKTVFLFIKDNEAKRRWKLQLLMIIVFLNYMVDIGSGDVYTLYTLASPFCFSPVLIGYFNAAQYLLRVIGSMIFIKIFENRLHDIVMMKIGNMSGIAAQIIMAIAMTPVLVFISPVVGILVALVTPIARSVSTKLVLPQEQGAMSASVSLVQQVSSLLGSVIFNSVYAETEAIYRGIVFIVTGSVYVISLLLMIVLMIRSQLEARKDRVVA